MNTKLWVSLSKKLAIQLPIWVNGMLAKHLSYQRTMALMLLLVQEVNQDLLVVATLI